MIDHNNSAYCPLIYQGLYVEKYDSETSRVGSCCINSKWTVENPIDFHHKRFQLQRQAIKKQKQIPGCTLCWEKENAGVSSRRLSSIDWFRAHRVTVDQYEEKLVSLDYNVDPICNAKCIICDSYYSSSWATEDTQQGIKPLRIVKETKRNNILKGIDLTQLRYVYFNGGEPLSFDEHLEVLKSVQQQKDLASVSAYYNTNGSVLPNDATVAVWQKLGKVVVNVSIDGTDSEFEYIRNPLSWNNVVKNIDAFSKLALGDLEINISYSLGIHNLIDDVEKTEEWFSKYQQSNPKIYRKFFVNFVKGAFDIANADRDLKIVFVQYLNNLDRPWTPAAIDILKDNINYVDRSWLSKLQEIDQRRNTDWQYSLKNFSTIVKKLSLL